MKIAVWGLGSMGKRRIRNLKSLGFTELFGIDIRKDRREESQSIHSIEVFETFEELLMNQSVEALVISLPPAIHHIAIKQALAKNIPCFIEASVLDTDFDEMISEAKQKNILLAPSCTLFFHPAIQKIKQIIDSKSLGVLSNIIYHSGQYLPDWHTYESVSDYYVSNPATGGAREIVPFELTWLTMVLGFPSACAGMFKKTIQISGAEKIDDMYNILFDYNTFVLNLNVDVVSRAATRKMTINGSEKQLTWDWNENCIKVYDPHLQQWEVMTYETISAQDGYNKNITEQMYIDEMKQFTNAVRGIESFQNTMQHDQKVLNLLYAAEESYHSRKIVDC